MRSCRKARDSFVAFLFLLCCAWKYDIYGVGYARFSLPFFLFSFILSVLGKVLSFQNVSFGGSVWGCGVQGLCY